MSDAMRFFVPLAAAAMILVIGTTNANETWTPESAAKGIADALETAADGGVLCGVQSNAKAIVCIANMDPSGADEVVRHMVLQARLIGLPLAGWSLTIATPSDYAATGRF